jgi:hypothetical protein
MMRWPGPGGLAYDGIEAVAFVAGDPGLAVPLRTSQWGANTGGGKVEQ